MPCGYGWVGEVCAASVCLEKMVAHFKEAHGAFICGGPFKMKFLDDGSKSFQMTQLMEFPTNGDGFLIDTLGNFPRVSKTPLGGSFAFELQRFGPKDFRFCVRQLGHGPPRHRLASLKVTFGAADGNCFQYVLSRALAAEERMSDAALRVGTPPAVGRVDPAVLAPTLVLVPNIPPPGKSWQLAITSTLVFQVVRDAPL